MGISNPGKAEEVITVGSLHSTKPHTYGISFFWSKGPLGDGRFEPHLVAPGEHIMSASLGAQDRYTEDGGASRGAPERSGVIAQFLSFNKEFREQAQAVKRILMDSCTDLGRKRNFHAAGMTDAFRMIQGV
jgi:serine protease AprX